MTGPDRHDVVAITASVALLWAVGVRAQATQAPSTLLPMEPLWTTVLSAAPAAAPVHDAGYIFVALRDGHVTAVNVADGEVAWEVELPVVGELATGGALLYVGSRNALQGIEAASGRVRWSIPLEAPLSAPLVWNNSWLIAALDTQILLAIRAETGETLWRQNLARRYRVSRSLKITWCAHRAARILTCPRFQKQKLLPITGLAATRYYDGSASGLEQPVSKSVAMSPTAEPTTALQNAHSLRVSLFWVATAALMAAAVDSSDRLQRR